MWLGLLGVAMLAGLGSGAARAEGGAGVVRIGVLAKRGADRCMSKWSATADYLSDQIEGRRFEIRPVDFQEVCTAVENGEVDFFIVNSSLYVDLEYRYGASRIATLKNVQAGRISTFFGGVVFCRRDRDGIKSADDLIDTRFMAVEENSFGGWLMARRELEAIGIDPQKDFEALTFGGTHDAVVYAVRDGKVDAGTVRTDTLERMVSEGLIQLSTFRVLSLHEGSEGLLPVRCSTRSYPEWPFAKAKHVPIELAERVARALLRMPADSEAARAARCAGWTIPLDYQPVHDCLRDLRIGPYEHLNRVNLTAVLRQYSPWIIASVCLVGLLIRHVVQLRRAHARERMTAGLLREREEQYRILAENTIDFVYWLHPNGTLAYVSPSAAVLTGYSVEELKAQPGLIDDMVHPEDHSQWRNHTNNVRRDVCVSPVELRIFTKSGELRWINHICRSLHDDKGMWLGVQGRDIDITERKRAESEAARAAACTEAVNHVLSGGLNCETEEELGRTCLAVARELTGSELGFFGFSNSAGSLDIVAASSANPDACRRSEGQAACSICDAIMLGLVPSAVQAGESRIINEVATDPDGVDERAPRLPIECSLEVPLKELGRTVGMIGLANKRGGYDAADQRAVELLGDALVAAFRRRWAEESLQRHNEELARYNAELAAAKASVEAVAADLERSNQELDDFAYIASHDLKEPLRGIHHYASFLLEDYAEKMDEDGREKLDALPRLAKRLESFIDSLLQFSRVGRTELGIQETDLNEVLAEVLDSLHVMVQEAGVDVRIPAVLPTVTCDRVRVGEVFRNLITNAMKYNDKDERWIEIGFMKGRSGDSPDAVGGDAPVFFVRDNGIGIPKKHIEAVFRIFKRLHGRDKYGGGTGAGLTIVKKIVERHGGRLWVESVLGVGTTFYFTLQSSSPNSAPDAAEQTTQAGV